MKNFIDRTVMFSALKDISEYIDSTYGHEGISDIYKPSMLNNKKTRFLNRELGLRGINLIGNKNFTKNK